MTRTDCVYFHFKVEELRMRTVTTTRYQGNVAVPVTRTETYWQTVVTDKRAVKCGIKDKTGTVRVDILDAETVLSPATHSTSGTFNNCPADLQRTLSRRYGFSTKGLLFNKGLRYTETVIAEGDRLFVIGDVETSRRGEPIFVRGELPFIVSDRSEAKVLGHYRTRSIWWLVGAIVSAVLTPLFAIIPIVILLNVPDGNANQVQPFAAANPQGKAGMRVLQPDPTDEKRNDIPRPPIVEPKKPEPKKPAAPDAITQAIEELRSPNKETRIHGASLLLITTPNPARQLEVLRATFFAGSSTIVRWDLNKYFPDAGYVNVGFGGSTIPDSTHFAGRIITPFKPGTIVFYAGDNDVSAGRKPEEVAEDFKDFVTAAQKTMHPAGSCSCPSSRASPVGRTTTSRSKRTPSSAISARKTTD